MTGRRVVLALAVVVAAALAVRLAFLGTPDLVGGDEGYYGTYARNILEGGVDQLVNLGREPLSAPDNKPFLFPLLLAGSVALFGVEGLALRLVPALAGLAIAACVAGLVARGAGRRAAAWAGGFALLLPPLVYASRVVMGEPLLAAFGVAGLWAAVVAVEERRTAPAVLAGVLWGCGFLVKLWLVGLFMIPLGAALLASRELRGEAASWWRMGIAALSFVLAGGLHLVLVAVLSPATLGYWLEQYFVFSLLGRAAGGEFAAYWHQPFTYYLRTTLETCFMALPLAALGVIAAPREPARAARLSQRMLWGVMLAELLLISAMQVKLRQYGFPLMPAVAALAGLGAGARLDPEIGDRPRWAAAAVTLLLVLPLAAWQLGPDPLLPSTAIAAAVAAVLLGAALLLAPLPAGLRRWDQRAGAALVAGALLAAAGGSAITVVREILPHRTGYREAAAAMAPYVADVEPTAACFLAPEVPVFQFHLFRTGRYWRTPYEQADDDELLQRVAEPRWRAFVTTSRADLYGGPTPDVVVAWLERNAVELTPEVRGAVGGEVPIRVFVRPPRGAP